MLGTVLIPNFAFNFLKLARELWVNSITVSRHVRTRWDAKVPSLQLSAHGVRGRETEVYRALNFGRGDTIARPQSPSRCTTYLHCSTTRWCRTPIIQHASSCSTALRLEVGRAPGTDLELSADQAYTVNRSCGGWATLLGRYRFCSYPQEVILRLEEPAKLEQIQILSHEYKVVARHSCRK